MTTPPPQIWPTLRGRDAHALIRFLVDVVGFEETAVYADGDIVHHAELSWPLGGGVMLGSAREEDAADPWPVQPGTFGAYVVVDDADALYDQVKAGGAEIVVELHDTDYGSRDFAIRDPEGKRWAFAPTAASLASPDLHRTNRDLRYWAPCLALPARSWRTRRGTHRQLVRSHEPVASHPTQAVVMRSPMVRSAVCTCAEASSRTKS